MRLSPAKIERTLTQFDAQAIPENHPSMPKLSKLFGDHTFFLDDEGLYIVEPAVTGEEGPEEGQVVKLARWNDEEQTSLAAHEPEVTDVVVGLGSTNPVH
jgi:hypothetical protein